MIRKEADYNNMTITVYLLNGEVFKNCDVPAQFFGEHERMVSFYYKNTIYIYPMNQVEHIEISF